MEGGREGGKKEGKEKGRMNMKYIGLWGVN